MKMEEIKMRYHRKIRGWYSRQEYEDKAVERMVNLREKFVGKLREINRRGTEELIDYLDRSGFFYRASSPAGHHNFPGGLAEHCYGAFEQGMKMVDGLSAESVAICTLLHDVCKADHCFFVGRVIKRHRLSDTRHSARSVDLIKATGYDLHDDEAGAIWAHMKTWKAQQTKNPQLSAVVFKADKDDCRALRARQRGIAAP